MSRISVIALSVTAASLAGGAIAQLTTARSPQFAVERKTIADVTSLIGGTWTLKQRINPDGTPYRSELKGATYISVGAKEGSIVGPHAVATVRSQESGVLDGHFFDFPKEAVGKPFQMESTGTWLIHSVNASESGGEIAARVFTMVKANYSPFTNGVVMPADIRYKVSRAAAAGEAVAPRLEFAQILPGDLTDFAGNKIPADSMARACCGVVALSVKSRQMDITWINKGKDVWVKSSTEVPAQFR